MTLKLFAIVAILVVYGGLFVLALARFRHTVMCDRCCHPVAYCDCESEFGA